MKTMAYAEFAALPEGAIFEFGFGPPQHTPGIYRKGKTWTGGEADDMEPGVSMVSLLYLIVHGEGSDTNMVEFRSDESCKDYDFRVYSPADLDRLAELIGRGTAAQVEEARHALDH